MGKMFLGGMNTELNEVVFQGPQGDIGPTGDPGRPGKDVSILRQNVVK